MLTKLENYEEALDNYQNGLSILIDEFNPPMSFENPDPSSFSSEPWIMILLHGKAQCLVEIYHQSLDLQLLKKRFGDLSTCCSANQQYALELLERKCQILFGNLWSPDYGGWH